MLALRLKRERVLQLAEGLVGVGLAEYVEPGYLRFDPALFGADPGADSSRRQRRHGLRLPGR